MEYQFYLTANYGRQTMVIHTWLLVTHFKKNKWNEPTTLKKTSDNIYCQWWNINFQVKKRIFENFVSTCIHCKTGGIPKLKNTFLMRLLVRLTNIILDIVNGMNQHFEDLWPLFSNDQCMMSQNHSKCKTDQWRLQKVN